MVIITPAILSDNIKDIEKKLDKIKQFTKWIQIDIMDGKFVSQISIKISELKNINHGPAKLEAHLMVQHPNQYIDDCVQVGIQRIIIHCEADNVKNTIDAIKKYPNVEIGIALNPETSMQNIAPFIKDTHLILLLAVTPGKQGQQFIPQTLQKIKEAKHIAPSIPIAVDGGINETNIQDILNAGADICCIGSAIVGANNPEKALRQFQQLAQNKPREVEYGTIEQ